MTLPETATREAIWHDVECGAYSADLPLWQQLAHEAAGSVLELGCGTGRVTLALAAAGHEVAGLDRSVDLLSALAERAASAGLEIETVLGDARALRLERDFALIAAPMQLVHLLGGVGARRRMLSGADLLLRARGVLAVALLSTLEAVSPPATPPPLPDVREINGWVYSSLPVEVRETGSGIEIHRLRQTVSPAGELSEESYRIGLDRLEARTFEGEAAAAGLLVRERIEVPATADHVGSTVVVLERSR